MKKYLIIKHFVSINSSSIYESLDSLQDAINMRNILQRAESNENIKYFVYEEKRILSFGKKAVPRRG